MGASGGQASAVGSRRVLIARSVCLHVAREWSSALKGSLSLIRIRISPILFSLKRWARGPQLVYPSTTAGSHPGRTDLAIAHLRVFHG